LDHLTAGFHRGELTVLAARPSMGKTALALNIAEHVAIGLQQPVLFVSLEMAAIELTNRLLCSRARVDGQRLRRGMLSQREQAKLVDEAGRISSAPLYIDETTARNITAIASTARRVKRWAGRDPSLVVIDYLQLVEPDNSKDPRQEQVARVARRLKALARDLKVPVLCLAQLNRQAEMTKDSRPRLSHLRESGAIEQDADVVMFIHREDYYLSGEEKDENKGRATLMIAKQRNGPVGDVELLFHDKYARFVSAERREREPDFQVFSESESDPFGP
jgi:replicative DNA helicase